MIHSTAVAEHWYERSLLHFAILQECSYRQSAQSLEPGYCSRLPRLLAALQGYKPRRQPEHQRLQLYLLPAEWARQLVQSFLSKFHSMPEKVISCTRGPGDAASSAKGSFSRKTMHAVSHSCLKAVSVSRHHQDTEMTVRNHLKIL